MSEERILKRFPNLHTTDWSIYSASSYRCNCAGFVIGFEANEMWPVDDDDSPTFWPAHLPKTESLKNFQDAYQSYGFTLCDSASFDDQEVVKIAIYRYLTGKPSHVAWQHARQKHWHSKIGSEEDIIHELDALNGPKPAYGAPALFMQISLDGFRKLWHEFAVSRRPRNGTPIAECERDLELNPR